MERAFIPDKRYMARALQLAKIAADAAEVPVGAVVVRDGIILGEGRNRREKTQNALAHAEIEAISAACERLGSWRLSGCQIYVTLEPCQMCAGAILNSRIERLVFGADAAVLCDREPALSLPLSGRIEVYRGFLEEECEALLKDFFEKMRSRQAQDR